MTKNEQIIDYIKDLPIGSKISVRQIAQDLDVSEGTAYKAIKDAERQEYVSTIPRVGTIRIEKVEKKRIDKVTFSEVLNIVEGQILGGHEGIYKVVNKFVIGAMSVDEVKKYISKGDLLIVGNRHDVHKLALDNDCAILITGGLSCSEEIKKRANEKKLPILMTCYDTFTITTMIDRALHERLIRKEILITEDIMTKELYFLKAGDTVCDVKKQMKITGHSRFPVVDHNLCVIGIISPKDISGEALDKLITNIMTKNPITVSLDTPVAYISHIMIWEGMKMIPVIENKKLMGVITRQDVIKGLKYIKNQPHMAETFEHMVSNQCGVEETKNGVKLTGDITPMMLNERGIASAGILVMLMSSAGSIAIKKQKNLDSVIDSFMIYFIKPLQLENKIEVHADVINVGRKFYKVDITAYHNEEIVSKAMMSVKLLRK
ncbi:DRTGG domain-containing protein [Marinisporobacter balticus]|uniref:Putative transcriptional regulator n=1 Tax=Marinisporobacter balticus TaxID=2018667 RepID=A0A4R2K859_9FIRM|nr:DRTGG domain-containing protein [Marinisporobacter balticus]TCO68774.1 putative transcriptional regulator [Marinisporobacter balticus]